MQVTIGLCSQRYERTRAHLRAHLHRKPADINRLMLSVKNAESIIFRGAKLLPEGLHGHTCRGFRRLEITDWAIHCGRYGFGLLIVGRSGSN